MCWTSKVEYSYVTCPFEYDPSVYVAILSSQVCSNRKHAMSIGELIRFGLWFERSFLASFSSRRVRPSNYFAYGHDATKGLYDRLSNEVYRGEGWTYGYSPCCDEGAFEGSFCYV